MPPVIDARGLGCGQPVILVKKALEGLDEITLLVGDRHVLENLKALAAHERCGLTVSEESPDGYRVTLKKAPPTDSGPVPDPH